MPASCNRRSIRRRSPRAAKLGCAGRFSVRSGCSAFGIRTTPFLARRQQESAAIANAAAVSQLKSQKSHVVVASLRNPARDRHRRQFRAPTPTGWRCRRSSPARFGRTLAIAPHASLRSDHRPAHRGPNHLLVQPAQQQYFRGSSTEIARLSPLLSCPCEAHDGQRATQFRPTCRLTST